MSASRMTIAWDRLDDMALLPEDSSVVIPAPITTIAWTPMLGPTIFDYDPTDMLVTPGAGEPVTPPPEGGAPGGETPGAPAHPRKPKVVVAARRSKKLFLKEGLPVHLHVDAPARVRAVLRAHVRTGKGKGHLLNLTKVATVDVGTHPRTLTLHPSRGGRRALPKVDGSVSASLILVFRYGPGFDPVHVTKHVTITG